MLYMPKNGEKSVLRTNSRLNRHHKNHFVISIEEQLIDLSTTCIQSEEDTLLDISNNVFNMKQKCGDDMLQLGILKKVKQLNESTNKNSTT